MVIKNNYSGDNIKYSRIVNFGHYLPSNPVSNNDLINLHNIDSNSEWINKRTGIKYRHFVTNGENTCDLAYKSAKNALERGNIDSKSIDLLILATTTPDHIFPATAARVAKRLNIANNAAAFDIQAVCSGFIFALATADNMIKLGQAKKALVIGADIYSRILDWGDRSTCILFGDGAGAAILSSCQPDKHSSGKPKGIIGHKLHTNGEMYFDLLVAPKVTTDDQLTCGHDCVQMNGHKVFKYAVDLMGDVVMELLETHGYTLNDLDYIIPHQANIRIIDSLARRFNIDRAKMIVTIEKHANISAASIPVALSITDQENKFSPGMLIAITALGGGFSWGGALIRL